HPVTVSKLAFSPDGHFLASAAGNIAYVWSVPDWKQHFSVTHTNAVTSIAWSRDGGRLLTASVDSTPQLLSGRTGPHLPRRHDHPSPPPRRRPLGRAPWPDHSGPGAGDLRPPAARRPPVLPPRLGRPGPERRVLAVRVAAGDRRSGRGRALLRLRALRRR